MPQLTILFILFSAIVILLYWLIPARSRTLFLCITGTIFLAYLDLTSVVLLAVLTACVYFLPARASKKWIYAALLCGLVLLFCGVRIAQLLQRIEGAGRWLILFGFGFYMLKLIHYCVERRTSLFRRHGFIDFYSFMMFFPTITIGPIHRFDDFLTFSRRIRWNDALFARGLERVLYGYVKVIVVANWLLAVQMIGIAEKYAPGPSGLSTIIDSAVYGFYLYFIFSGYSDVAIGLAMLFGYRLCENFHHPFLKRNIGEFWQSWHMSLSSWCRQYVFLPLFSKSRNLPAALLLTMATIGMWHEFSIRYLLWGLYHGAGLLIWRWHQRTIRPLFPEIQNRVLQQFSTGLSVAFTFFFVVVGFTIPRSASWADIVRNFRLILGA